MVHTQLSEIEGGANNMVVPKAKYRVGTAVQILPRGGKGKIVRAVRTAGNLYFSYAVRYKTRKGAKLREDWFGERSLRRLK